MSHPFEEAWEQVGRDVAHLLHVWQPAHWTPELVDTMLGARHTTLGLLAGVGHEPVSFAIASVRPTLRMLESDPARTLAMVRDQGLPAVLPQCSMSDLLAAHPSDPDVTPWHALMGHAAVASHAFAGLAGARTAEPTVVRWSLRQDVAALTSAVLALDGRLAEGLAAVGRPADAGLIIGEQTSGLRTAARVAQEHAAAHLSELRTVPSRMLPGTLEPLAVPDATWVKPAWRQLLRLVADTPLTPRELREITAMVRRPLASTLTPERWRDWSSMWSRFEHRLERHAALVPSDGRAVTQAHNLVAFAASRIPGAPAGDLLELRYAAGLMTRGAGPFVRAVSCAVDRAFAAGRWVSPDGDVSIGEPVWVPVVADEDVHRALSTLEEAAAGVGEVGENMLRRRAWRPALPEHPAAILAPAGPEAASARTATTLRRARAFADRAQPVPSTQPPTFPTVRGPSVLPS